MALRIMIFDVRATYRAGNTDIVMFIEGLTC